LCDFLPIPDPGYGGLTGTGSRILITVRNTVTYHICTGQFVNQSTTSPDAVQLRILLPLNFSRFAAGFAAALDGAAAPQAAGAGGAAGRLGAGRRGIIIVLGAGGGGRRTLTEIQKLVAFLSCCGSVPGCLSRIPDPNFFHPGSRIRIFFPSRIPDPHQRIQVF
jgi:hypothetical protein